MKNKILFFTAFLFLSLAGCSSDGSNDTAGNGAEIGKGDGQGGSLAVFALVGNYLYTVDHASLNVFSLSGGNGPVKVSTVMIGNAIETLFARENMLYIGSRDGMYIYSLDNPENPSMISAVQHFTACDPVVANATHSFVTLHSNTFCGNMVNVLNIYNTTDPSHPVLLHTEELTYPKGLGLYGNYLFVCDDVIKIFDITNPEAPSLAGTINKVCFDVIIRGNDLFAVGENGLSRYQLNPTDINSITFKSDISF
ncbi:hypothetical protein [uncultured Flavobacterium sp.]|uniref:hypothetical protein n=1 Tax=uncultured Flavobacterium sp. TaxID=165435 RepID=UPI0025D55F0C|nr:hypothetical protein [uncultured Flavobacterium sp.]